MGSVEAKFKQLLSNFEAETSRQLSNLRLADKKVAYKIESSVTIYVQLRESFYNNLLNFTLHQYQTYLLMLKSTHVNRYCNHYYNVNFLIYGRCAVTEEFEVSYYFHMQAKKNLANDIHILDRL